MIKSNVLSKFEILLKVNDEIRKEIKILNFKQKAWLKIYIEFTTIHRKSASSFLRNISTKK